MSLTRAYTAFKRMISGQSLRQAKLQTRLTILMLGITIPLIAAVLYFVSTRVGEQVTQNAVDRLGATNRALASNVSVWLNLNDDALRMLIANPHVISMESERQKPLLETMAATYPHMYLVSITDWYGLNVSRSDDLPLKDYHRQPWQQMTRNARPGDPLTLVVAVDEATNQPALVAARPIRRETGTTVGVAMFASTVTNITQEVLASKVGETGFAYIVDSQNRVVAHPDPTLSAELQDLDTYPPVYALRGGTRGITSFTGDQGQRWWAFVDEMENGWGVIVQQQESEFLGELNRLRQITWVATILGALVQCALAWLIIRQTLRPISQLTDTATAIAAGELERRAPVESEDEVGILAQAFNSMTEQLNVLIHSLEKRVTELKRAQETLQESEVRYRTLFDGVPVSLYRTTPAGQFLDANPAMVQTLGYPDRESLLATAAGDHYLDLADRERGNALLEQKGIARDFEFQARRYDGTTIWLRDTANLVKDEQGQVLCYEGMLEDITERKRAEAERDRLLAAESEQRRLAEALRQAGAALSSTLNYDRVVDLILEQVSQVVPHDTTNIMLIQGDQAEVFRELASEQPDAQSLASSLTVDIAEFPILQRMQTTGQPEAIPHVERDRDWVYAAPEHRWIKSYAGAPIRMRDQVIGFLNVNSRTPGFFDQTCAGQLQAFADQAAIAIGNARLYRQAQEELAERVRVESELRGYQEHLEELVRERTSKLAQATREAEEARIAAEAANRAKSVFLANMSHELRTPLNAILGFAQLMERDPSITPTLQEYLETISRSGEHLLGLINDVLTMSKIEAGRIALQENAFDLHWQLHGLQEMFQLRAAEEGLTLLLDIAPDVPRYVHTDEGKLRQVLMNLLSNAVKFTEEGGVTLRVKREDVKREIGQTGEATVTDRTSNQELHHITFEVEDTGIGIASEELEALFDPFVQTASGQRSQEGTGLGLPICRQFVSLMGGELNVSSIVEQGTTFCVQIPVALAAADEVQVLESQPQRRVTGVVPGQTAPDGGPFRFLIVEDQAANRQLLIELLTPFGFEVHIAVNGAEGVVIWENWQPHLVWMDMRMPVMDGYEATRQIKARAAATEHSTIVVALTASAFDEEREAILAAGCDDFVRKPFREHEIFDVLHRHLGLRFIYEATTPIPQVAECVSTENLQAAIEKLPAAWVADLQRSAVALDVERLLALVEAVRPQAPQLADTLAQWVNDFEFDKLLALVDPAEQ